MVEHDEGCSLSDVSLEITSCGCGQRYGIAQMEARLATLQARGDRLANAVDALNNSFEKHRPKALWDEAREALTEWRKPC